MIIGLNTVANSITLTRTTKKGNDFVRVFDFDYSLLPLDNKIRAIHEMLADEIVKELSVDKANTLLISDDLVFSDIMEFPPLSKGKVEDIFNTRFKLLFTQAGDLYMSFNEIDRNKSKSVIQYTISNVNKIKKITDAFFERGIVINATEYFSHHFISQFAKVTDEPTGYLFIGPHNSELVVYNKDVEVFSQAIKFGEKELLDPTNYLESGYNVKNNEAKKYASYIKKNFASSVQATDEEIFKTEIEDEYIASLPREIRVLKDQALENYVIKHNFRLLHGLILDCVDSCSKAPWFIPVNSIYVVSSDKVFETLQETSDEAKKDIYLKAEFSLNDVLSKPAMANPLFSNGNIVTEKQRRKIEWSKILTMEIGKKKKA